MQSSNNPKVSVLVPVYNYEKYVGKCIESVLNQTYKNIEIIAVDDGSTDDSGKILDEYSQKDARLRVIHKENGGIGSAIKVAFEKATGEYIAFLDSDDYMELDAYEKLVEVAVENDSEIVVFGLKKISMDGQIRHESNTEPGIFLSNKEIMDDYLLKNPITVLSRKFIKASLLKDLDMMNYSVGIDEVISIQVMSRCNKLIRIKDCYYNYVAEPEKDSVSRRAIDGKHVRDIIKMHQDIIGYIQDNNSDYLCSYILRYLNVLTWQYISVKKNDKNKVLEKEICSEYKYWWKMVNKTKELKNKGIKGRIRLYLFEFSPFLFSVIEGMRFERE